MAKKTLTNNRDSAIKTIGLDIGYGVTKAITDEQALAFPSVIGYAVDIKFRSDEIARAHPGDQITDEDGDWFVGDLALSQLRAGGQLRLRGRTSREAEQGNVFRTRLAKVAIGKLFPGRKNREIVHLRIATGLPVDHMPDQALLKEALIGQHVIETDQTSMIANVTEVMVMPQPYGTIYADMLTPDGSVNDCYVYERTGVLDVGTYTLDAAFDDNGEYIEQRSGSVESGVFTAHERIAAAIERDYREKPDHKLVESVLRTGWMKARGENVSYQAEVDEALEPLRSATLTLMNDRWQGGMNIDVILLTGGGAELVKTVVLPVYRQARVVNQSQMANARGYLQYAHFRTSNPD
jgi:plasmid segregation protein ParM